MNYIMKDNRISYMEDEKELAASTFPIIEGREGVININNTFVDPSLKGKGIGGNLMKKIVEKSKKEGWKILPTCPFASAWFKKHPEYHDLLHTSLGK